LPAELIEAAGHCVVAAEKKPEAVDRGLGKLEPGGARELDAKAALDARGDRQRVQLQVGGI
jgi:hypothetical protein